MTSPYAAPLSDLMDDFAMNAMAQLIHIYAPEKLQSPDEIIKWCKHMAGISYAMASIMMDTRVATHKGILEDHQNKEANEA